MLDRAQRRRQVDDSEAHRGNPAADESDELVRAFVARGMARQLDRIAEFERMSGAASGDRSELRELEALERDIEAGGGWNVDVRISTTSPSEA